MPQTVTTVDAYIAGFETDVRPLLERVRQSIHAALPGAEERIRYGMPAVMIDDRHAVHFAGWKHHIGLYPVPALPAALEAEIAPYRAHKDTLRFLYSQPIPYDLIERVSAAVRDARRPGAS